MSVTHDQCSVRPMVTFPATDHPHSPLGHYSFPIPLRVGGWVGLSGWLHTKTVYTWMIVCLSTNWFEHTATSLTWPTQLPLGHIMTSSGIVIRIWLVFSGTVGWASVQKGVRRYLYLTLGVGNILSPSTEAEFTDGLMHIPSLTWLENPAWGRVTPFFCLFSSLVLSVPYLLLFYSFFLFSFALPIFFCPSLPFLPEHSPLHFQARDRRRRSNLGLICFVYFVLSILLSYDLFWCFVVFGLV